MMKTVLITGATSGIGKACAETFAQAGYRLILTGRRKDRLEKLSSDLSRRYGNEVLCLNFDVRDEPETTAQINSLPAEWKTVDVLINNAGLAAGRSTIDEGSLEDWETMIDTNVKGLLYVSRAVIPLMKARSKGHIINLGSIAGKEAYLGGNVYCATKHAVDALTKSMRIDLLPYGIKVTGVCPGAVETEFSLVRFKWDEEKARSVYEGYEPLRPSDVADAVFYAVTRPAHVNINDLVIMPTAQANTTHLFKKQA